MTATTSPGEGVTLVVTTCPSRDVAAAIAETLVSERLAACGNLVPSVRSIYRWEGAIEREEEHLLLLKTTAARLDALASRLETLHPYDVPELLAFAVDRGLPAYLSWVVEETESGS